VLPWSASTPNPSLLRGFEVLIGRNVGAQERATAGCPVFAHRRALVASAAARLGAARLPAASTSSPACGLHNVRMLMTLAPANAIKATEWAGGNAPAAAAAAAP
jgi:hypothetical protein